jgi:SulP family sulfate permease
MRATAGGFRFSFRPRLVDALRGYTGAQFHRDLSAGFLVGIVALPLAIGFGIASGVTPAAGITSAIVGGFLVSALGGSRVQIGGPAGAFVGLLYTIVGQYGLPSLLICTFLAGVFLFVLGAVRLGSLIKFIPHPVTTGFTCGIAITIMTTQVRDFLGLRLETVPAEFLEKIPALARALPTFSGPTVLVGLGALVVTALWPRRIARLVPGSIVALVGGTLVVALAHLPVDTIGTRFGPGAFPRGLPAPALPGFNPGHLLDLLAPALAITLLGAIESLLSAVVADGMIDDRHDSNQELMGQGIANMVVPFFGGIPVTGVIARTATNVRNGAGTPVAGIVHAVTLLVVVLAAAPLAQYVPLTVLGAVLLFVAFRMGEWDEFLVLGRQARSDAAVFLLTFGLTVVFDLTVAVKGGLVLAAGLFIKRVADTTQVFAHDEAEQLGHEPVPDLPRGVMVYRVFGALLFGAADKLDGVMRRANSDTRVVILHLAALTALDGTALRGLETLHKKLRRHGRQLILSGPHTQPYFLMEKSGFLDAVGMENVVADLSAAVVRAQAILGEPPATRTATEG